MNGNNPYAGAPGVVDAGKRTSAAEPELSAQQRRQLRDSLARIVARTRKYLPDEYAVGSEITAGVSGARARVAVRPPIGDPVSAGFDADAGHGEEVPGDEDEVARGLAASAALQMKLALGDDVPQVAK